MRFWITLCFLGIAFQISAQKYNFRNYSLKEGLPQSEINSITYGPNGGIWAGTNGGGLARFNGDKFEVFSKKTLGLLHDQVTELLFDKKNRLWMGTSKGISRFDGTKVKNYPLPSNAPSEFFHSFIEDTRKPGRMWIASFSNSNIKYIEGDKEVNFTAQYPKKLKNIALLSFFKLNNGNILIGTNRGAFEYDGTQLKTPDALRHEYFKGKRVTPFLNDASGNLWLWVRIPSERQRKLVRHFKDEVEVITLPEEFANFNFRNSGFKDRQGNLWLNTGRNNPQGVIRYRKKKFQHISMRNGLPTNRITDITEDNEGNIWFGTRGFGMLRYSGDTFTLYDKDNIGLSSNFQRAIYQDGVGNYWFGTGDAGISKFDGTNTVNYFDTPGNQIGRVHDFLKLDDKQFLVTTARRGLLKFDGEKFAPANKEYGIPANITNVQASFRIDDTFWFAAFGLGVIEYSPEKVDTLTQQKDNLVDNFIHSITKDKDGNIWFGSLRNTTGGMSRYNGKKMITWHKGDAFKTDLVMQMAADDAGGMWIATYGEGLVRYFKGKFTYYTTENGVNSNTVYSVIKDNDGHIWIGVQNGIQQFILDRNGEVITIKHLSREDGFMGLESNGKAIYKDAQGNLWFGTMNGAVKYNPHARRLHHQNAILNITDVRLSLRSVDWQSEKYKEYLASVNSFFSIPQKLKLPHNLNHISIHFEGISHFIPEKVQYKWRLEGLENEWSPASKSRKVTYTNLSPGKYTLHLQATNSWGQWSNRAYSYQFEIMKPYWETWWFRILMILMSILLLTLVFRWRLSAIKAREKELKRLVDAKTVEVRTQNEEILEKNTELEQQKEEILVQNEQIHLQNEEIQVQRDQLELSFQNVQLLSEIGQKVTANLSVQRVADTFHEQITRVMEVDEFGIGLYDAEQKALVFDLIYVHNDRLPTVIVPVSQRKRLSVHCFMSKTDLVSGNVYHDFAEYVNTSGVYNEGELLNSLLCVPIMEGEEALGVITIQARKPDAYGEHHLSMLRSLSTYVAIATNNSSVFSQVKLQKQEIEVKNKNITASINYAKQIQQAILGRTKDIARYFNEVFVMLKPKDIVSGDFYWCANVTTEKDHKENPVIENKVVLVAADCTGHGVPGAFMTLMGSDFLDDIISKEKITQPDLILEKLEQRVIARLQRDDKDRMNDGMDMAVVTFDREKMKLEFAGAKNPLWLISNGELKEYKGSKYPIGGSSQYTSEKVFNLHHIDLQEGDILYMFSDGFQDQFGGSEGKKFMRSQLRKLLLDIYHKPMPVQKKILEDTLKNWMSYLPKNSELKQVDDILVIGVSV